MIEFLFVSDAELQLDPKDAAKILKPEALPALEAAHNALSAITEWNLESIETALRDSLIDGMGLKPRLAFGPVRVAVTGRRVSPPLFESLDLLGRDSSLTRLQRSIESLR